LNEFEHFYYGEIGKPQWMGTSCYEQWIDPLVPNETRLFSNEIQI